LALLLTRQYEFPQCGINKGNFFFETLSQNDRIRQIAVEDVR
jgi:hypothetical protein